MSIPITSELFIDHLNCQYKSHLKLAGRVGVPDDFEVMQARLAEEYRRSAAKSICADHKSEEVLNSPASVVTAVKHGYALLVDVQFTTRNLTVRIDAVSRLAGKSASNAHYFPILFIRKEKVTKLDKLLLAFCGLALGHALGKQMRFGRIIHGPHFHSTRIELPKLIANVEQQLQSLEATDRSHRPPVLRLNAHCSACEFNDQCRTVAIEKDDLSLLRSLPDKEIDRQHQKGIFTVSQYSHTYRPRRNRKRRATVHIKHDHALQALAIREKTIIVASTPQMPDAPRKIYIDIEGVPERQFYYLIGVHICDEKGTKDHFLWADDEMDERNNWFALLEIIGSRLDDCTVFHYGSFDKRAMEQMQRRHEGDSATCERLISKLHNVLSQIYGNVYFPTYSNGLKDVAAWLGFNWSVSDATGLKSLVWRHQWENNECPELKKRLVVYNRDDCVALKTVTHALYRIASGEGQKAMNVKNVLSGFPNLFKRNDFFFPDLERINECAYFDYQRTKVYIRTSDQVRQSLRRVDRQSRRTYRVNQEVRLPPPTKCLHCQGDDLVAHGALKKTVYDLRFSNGGVRRWIVRYKSSRYLCRSCLRAFAPPNWRSLASSKYGPTLLAWMAYRNISLCQSHGAIAQEAFELFGYWFHRGISSDVKTRVSDLCEASYGYLVDRVKRGHLLHADETQIKIRMGTGYVWVFTNLEEIVYVYSETREASVVTTFLEDYNGVLVSDFYTAYDSLQCAQQKCLVHLIRDMNTDLFKNQFDSELIQLCREFTEVLSPIIKTVDKYGLKRRNLSKHRREASRFIGNVEKRRLTSTIAIQYQKRIVKYGERLFTFLAYDGVPWNNNNAENAIKRFAILRQVIKGVSTPGGLREYLILLSICETLRRKGRSFLDFLVSGNYDLAAYLEH